MSDENEGPGPRNDDRYRTLFENVPIPLREEDLSAIKAKVDALGFADLEALTRYLDANPDFIDECGRAVRIVDANAASVRMYSYADRIPAQVRGPRGARARVAALRPQGDRGDLPGRHGRRGGYGHL